MSSRKKSTKLSKNNAWFVRVRGSYVPVAWQGWLSYIPYIVYLWLVVEVAKRSDASFIQVCIVVLPQWAAAAIVMTWLATIHSDEPNKKRK